MFSSPAEGSPASKPRRPKSIIALPNLHRPSRSGRRNHHGGASGGRLLRDHGEAEDNGRLRLQIGRKSLEYWSFEMVVLLSGLLPNPKLETSVLSISLNTMWIVYTIPTGLSSAVSIRVSNELGAGHPLNARLSVYAVVIIATTEGLVLAVATILVRHIWGYLYSNEEEVVKYVATMMPFLAASDFMDGVQCALSGAARGCGWQKICSYINLGAYYAVGIPCAILLAFVMHVGGKGLWLGIICALTIQVVVLVSVILHTNWDEEASKARERLQSSAIISEAT